MNKTGRSVQGAGCRKRRTRVQKGHCSLLIALVFLLFIAGCGGGGGNPQPPPVACKNELESQLSSAWTKYDAGSYSEALSLFTSGLTKCTDGTATDDQIARSYSGMGFSNFKLNDQTSAKSSFTSATQKNASLTEAYAGLALVSDAQDSYTEMRDNAVKVESLNSSFSFSHSPVIKMADIYVIAARAYLAGGDLANFRAYYCKAKSADPTHTSVQRLTDFYDTYKNPSLAACP